MGQIFVIILIFCLGVSTVFSKDNALNSLKIIPLPEDKVRIDFLFDKPLDQLPASFTTQKPARLVLDFVSMDLHVPQDFKMKTIELGSLRSYTIASVADRVRVILDLERTVSYSGSASGPIYSVLINGKSHEIFKTEKEIFITNRPVSTKHLIEHIDFRGIEKQGGRILVDVSDSSIPVDVTQTGKEVVVNFLNAQIPPNLMKRFDVVDFHSPVQLFNLEQVGKNVRMTILNQGDFGHYVYQVNKQLMIDIFPLTSGDVQQSQGQVFKGKRLSLNFQNIKIRAVLQLLADFTGINMVVSDKVRGTITLRLNNTPWDQALDIILTTQDLDKRQSGTVLLIDTKSSLDKMEENELKNQQAIQKLEPVRSDLLQINYAKAVDIAFLIKDKQNSLLSPRGKISVDVRTNTLWIQDTRAKIEEVRELIKQLDVPVKQVLIEARIVEVSKDFSEDLGIRWGGSRPEHLSGTLQGANAFQVPPGSLNPATVPIADRLNLDLIAAPVSGAIPASVGVALARLGDNILLDLELSALESEGRAELISSPRLITTNQQSAVIEQGQEIPYQEATSSGATAVAFKKAVLSLKVTPQITPDNKILMDLQINQDSPSLDKYLGVPAILTKQIQTNVLVNNGQTIVLGGIYKQDKNNRVKRIPFFGELPVVGILFSNKQVSLKNDELLIFITPKIITNSLSITSMKGQEIGVYK